jgi:hypothetical protein
MKQMLIGCVLGSSIVLAGLRPSALSGGEQRATAFVLVDAKGNELMRLGTEPIIGSDALQVGLFGGHADGASIRLALILENSALGMSTARSAVLELESAGVGDSQGAIARLRVDDASVVQGSYLDERWSIESYLDAERQALVVGPILDGGAPISGPGVQLLMTEKGGELRRQGPAGESDRWPGK